jgi:anti-repressor protein
MNELKIFEHPSFGQVRAIEKDGEAWFYASDVAKALGYQNASKAVSDHCKKVNKISHANGSLPPLNVNIINQGDVLRLIVRSTLPQAQKIEEWIFDVVVPSVLKHGAYLTPDVLAQTIADPSYIIGVVTALKQEQEARKLVEQKLALDAPMTQLGECVIGSDDLIFMDEFVKIARNKIRYYKGQNGLFDWMRQNGYIRKDKKGYNVPTALSDKMGVLKLTLEPRQQGRRTVLDKVTKITPKGISYFLRKLLDDDVSPYQTQSNLF